MQIKNKLTTLRLTLDTLSERDKLFMFELMNSEGWIQYIGDRNIHSEIDALAYIQKVNTNSKVSYWIVKLKDTDEKIGIITFIKRDYLDHNDIGFAFLPNYFGQGYAFEATKEVLKFVKKNHNLSQILATTIPENINSVTLLKKLGFEYEKSITVENETLHVYNSLTENY